MGARHPTRSEDEKQLAILKLRSNGLSCAQIAQRHGMAVGSISRLTNPVRDADLSESGEPHDVVLAGYW